MLAKLSRRMTLMALTSPLVMLLGGCYSGADDPQIADAPPFTPPEDVPPPVIPGQEKKHFERPKYKEMMDKMDQKYGKAPSS